MGSDSAPHPRANKVNKAPRLDEHLEAVPACACAAGLFTSAILIPLCAHLLESFGALDKLEGFVSKNGRAFYNIAPKTEKAVTLVKQDTTVPVEYTKSNGEGDSVVVPFMAGKTIKWQLL